MNLSICRCRCSSTAKKKLTLELEFTCIPDSCNLMYDYLENVVKIPEIRPPVSSAVILGMLLMELADELVQP